MDLDEYIEDILQIVADHIDSPDNWGFDDLNLLTIELRQKLRDLQTELLK